jgi:hypothetical protein
MSDNDASEKRSLPILGRFLRGSPLTADSGRAGVVAGDDVIDMSASDVMAVVFLSTVTLALPGLSFASAAKLPLEVCLLTCFLGSPPLLVPGVTGRPPLACRFLGSAGDGVGVLAGPTGVVAPLISII